jgi:hypothetical protein
VTIAQQYGHGAIGAVRDSKVEMPIRVKASGSNLNI